MVVEPDAASLARALDDVLRPERAEHYARMARAARARVEESWAPQAYRRRLVEVATAVTAARATA